MTVSIKIGDDRKRKIDHFLARLMFQEGALEDEEAFTQNFKELPPLEKDLAWKMLEKPEHWGVKDASTRIDEYLYKNRNTQTGVENFLNLKKAISIKWSKGTSVLQETRRSRRHETAK